MQERPGHNEQVAQPWQRDRASSAISRRWVTLKRNFRLKGYLSRQYPWTATDRRVVTTLPPDVFTQINFVADFIRLKLTFIFLNVAF